MSINKPGPLIVGKRDAVDFGHLIDDYRAGKFTPPIEEEFTRRSKAKTIECDTLMLMENLRANKVAYAEKLVVDTESYITDIVVLGWPEASVEAVEVRVGVAPSNPRGGGTTTFNIPLEATAEEFKEITGVTGEVSLGAQTITKDDDDEVLLVPSRWRVRWERKEDAEPIFAGNSGHRYMVRVEETLLYGTGNLVKVIQTLPTGWDTPLRAGAICEAVKGQRPGSYYKVIGAEARFWYGTEISSGAE